jgi:tetratricopeptide (TPR) repeat protein
LAPFPIALASPGEEAAQRNAVTPNEAEESPGGEIVHVAAPVRLSAPANIRAAPGAKAIAFGLLPVIAEPTHVFLLDAKIAPDAMCSYPFGLQCADNSRRGRERVSAEDHYYAGIDFFGEGKLDEAIAEYQKALEINPGLSDALHGIAQACYAKQDFDAAIDAANRILLLDAEDILALTTISRSYQRKGMVPEAEEAGNKARVLGWKKQLREQKPQGE